MAMMNRVEIAESKALAPDVYKVILIGCEYCNVTKKKLLCSKRGTGNIAKCRHRIWHQ